MATDDTITLDPIVEEQAKDLFARQLKALSRQGAAPGSEACLEAIFSRNEAACRLQEASLASEAGSRTAADTPLS